MNETAIHQQVKLKYNNQETIKNLMQNIAKISQKVKQRGSSVEESVQQATKTIEVPKPIVETSENQA